MFINILLAASLGVSGVFSTSENSLPKEVSSKIALYLLVSVACDKMTGSNAEPTAKAASGAILQRYGFSSGQVDVMFKGFIGENLNHYIDSIVQASDNNDAAIRYFCSSTVKQKRELVEEIKAYNSP